MNNKKREYCGLQIVVDNETYEQYKGTLQEQVNELQSRIDKALEIYENAILFEKQCDTNHWEYDGGREEYEIMLEKALSILKGEE